MIRAEALVQKFQYALDNNWGYIWGKAGVLWTEAKQNEIIGMMKRTYGSRWKNDTEGYDRQ